MQKKMLLSVVLLLWSVFSAAAGTQHCRSGVILAAEVTTAALKIVDLNELAFPNMPEKRAYAVLSLKLDDMRELSIFDYSLEIRGASFPCVAVFRNNRYEYHTGNVSGQGVQQLIFVIDGSNIPATGIVNAVLKSNLSEVRFVYDVSIPLTVIGSRIPKSPGSIPASGLLIIR